MTHRNSPIYLQLHSDLLNECIATSANFSEGDGQFARANYKISQLYAETGKSKDAEESLKQARATRVKMVTGTTLSDDESIETYNKLNLWMLW